MKYVFFSSFFRDDEKKGKKAEERERMKEK